jgi:hypothetical protein
MNLNPFIKMVIAVACYATIGLLERLLQKNEVPSKARQGILPWSLRSIAFAGLRFAKFLLPIAVSQGLPDNPVTEFFKRGLPILDENSSETRKSS